MFLAEGMFSPNILFRYFNCTRSILQQECNKLLARYINSLLQQLQLHRMCCFWYQKCSRYNRSIRVYAVLITAASIYCTTCSLFVYWDWLCWCSMDRWDSLYPSEIEYFVETAMVKPYATLHQVISCHFQFSYTDSDQECGNLGEDYRRLKSFRLNLSLTQCLYLFGPPLNVRDIAEFVAGCGKGVCFPCMLRASSMMFGKARVRSFLRAACPSRLLCLRWSVNLCCGRYGLPKRYGLLFLTKLGGCMSVAWLRMTTRTLKTWFSILAWYSSWFRLVCCCSWGNFANLACFALFCCSAGSPNCNTTKTYVLQVFCARKSSSSTLASCQVFWFEGEAGRSQRRAPARVDEEDFAHNREGFLRKCGSVAAKKHMFCFFWVWVLSIGWKFSVLSWKWCVKTLSLGKARASAVGFTDARRGSSLAARQTWCWFLASLGTGKRCEMMWNDDVKRLMVHYSALDRVPPRFTKPSCISAPRHLQMSLWRVWTVGTDMLSLLSCCPNYSILYFQCFSH